MGFDNSGVIIGNLTGDPELRFTDSGMAVANLRLAWNKRVAEGEDVAHFFSVVCFRSLAENAAESFSKGDRVVVPYTLQQRSYESTKWTDAEGKPANIQVVELVADDISPSTRWASVSITRNPKEGTAQVDAQAEAAGVKEHAGAEPF